MKVIEFITFCYCDVDACRVRLPPFSANDVAADSTDCACGN